MLCAILLSSLASSAAFGSAHPSSGSQGRTRIPVKYTSVGNMWPTWTMTADEPMSADEPGNAWFALKFALEQGPHERRWAIR